MQDKAAEKRLVRALRSTLDKWALVETGNEARLEEVPDGWKMTLTYPEAAGVSYKTVYVVLQEYDSNW